ncbi:MAG: hypothetical protein IJB89_04300 [Akkermansia sp.]|nr:hypothetical protein [Akkermansia sp.]
MNIKTEELKKLQAMLAGFVEKNGAVSITKGNANNCTCGSTCTYTCTTYCDGNYDFCWKSWKGK